MNIKIIASAAVSALMIAGSATAATLSFGGDTSTAILPGPGGGYDGFSVGLLGDVNGLNVGSTVTTVSNAIGIGGLQVDEDNVQFEVTYLGSEAFNTNEAFELASGGLGSVLFSNDGSAQIGDTATFTGGLSGFIEFLFKDVSQGETIQNGDTSSSSPQLSIGFSEIFDGGRSVIALFGDGLGDADFDDLAVKISIVPLPAGGLLLLTALGGIGLARRKNS